MYNRELVSKKISETEAKLRKPIFRYTHEYIRVCVEHLEGKAVKDDKGRFKELKSPLLPDEQEFIRNERLLCALDYDHWASNYHKIRDSNTQQMIHFKRNFAQEVLNQVYCEMQAKGVPIMIQSLKARQLGITTDSASRGQHRAQFIPNTSGVLASSDEDKTWKLSEMIQRSLREQPWWLLPEDMKQYVSGEVFLESPQRNMTIGIQHGRQTSGISRGDTINYYHLSEIPDYGDPQALINNSLMKAMHPTSLTFGMLESTANGRNDWWHKRWKHNQKHYMEGRSLEYPVFLPWFLGRDIYPTKGWLSGIPVPADWTPPDFVVDHASKAREYVLNHKLIYTALGLDWRMPIEQMWFYWNEYELHRVDGRLSDFYSEMPANDLEAFQSKKGQVFSIELLQQYQDKSKEPIGVYGIQGEGIPTPLWPEASDVDQTKPPIQVIHFANMEAKPHSFTLTPVKTLGPEGLDRLVIWEMPQKGYEYGVGLDGAEGKGLDRTSLPVIRKGTPLSPAEVVARLYTDKVATLEIWPVWLCLLKLYSPVYQGEYTWAMACPETNRGGDAAMMELRKLGWPNIYMRTKIDSRLRLLSPKLGWETTPKTRDQLVQWILMIIKGMYAQLNDVQLIDELRDFIVTELQTKIRLEAGHGSHDDLIFSFIITMICLHGIDVYQAETPHWRRVMDDAKELMTFPKHHGLYLPTAEMEDNQFTSQTTIMYANDLEEEFENA